MCGIAGFSFRRGLAAEERARRFAPALRRMTAALWHRGPDAQRALLLDGMALGHTRLAIVDLAGGAQPMRDPATGVTLVYNGEVFNHVELREELRSYPFRTRSDTEVVLAAFLRWGLGCLERFNGQFALALYDPRSGVLHLARDRFGILPLHHAAGEEGGIAFASEAKGLLAGGFGAPRLDPRGVKQVMQLWSAVPPRTCVEGVSALPPGCVATWDGGALRVSRWWDLDLEDGRVEGCDPERATAALGEVLQDAVRLRLRADVPVAAYLSGGLDSALLCALAQRQLGGTLSTWSVAFSDASFDESRFQAEVATALETRHGAVTVDGEVVRDLLPEAVRHAESALVRTAPAPLLWLSREVRAHAGKVVLTGEGSDEVLLGYDLYRETRVRQFWARRPESRWRPALLRRLYPYLPMAAQGDAVLRHVFGIGLDRPCAPGFSHLVRWNASARSFRLLAPAFAEATAGEDPVASLLATVPERVASWRPLAQAQYLEMSSLLAGNLLGPQGDRMLMGGSVEGRFPYLDHRLVELAARLPDRLKLRGLTGKWILRRYASGRVPPAVLARPKFPYRAPPPPLDGRGAPVWARTLLSPDGLAGVGVFDPEKVRRLAAKLAAPGPRSEVDAMGATLVATTQLLAHALRQTAPPAARVEAVEVEVA